MSNLNSTDLALSKRLRILCEDYENRPYVVKRGVLSSIVKFLSHESLSVATNAAEALLSLSEHPDNPTPMCREKSLLPALSAAYKKYSLMVDQSSHLSQDKVGMFVTDEQTIEPAQLFNLSELTSVLPGSHISEIISNIVSHLEKSLVEMNSFESVEDIKTCDETTKSADGNDYSSYLRTASVIHRQRSVVLDIPSLAEENVNQLAALLESIRGIMSFTIDFNCHVVRLLLTTPTASVLRILDDNGFISIILHEENIAPSNFHHIGTDNGLRYVSTEDYVNEGKRPNSFKRSKLIAHGHRHRKIKQERKKNEMPKRGVLGYIASWM